MADAETVGIVAALYAVARVIEGGFRAMIKFFKKRDDEADTKRIHARLDALLQKQTDHEKEDAAIHADFKAMKDDVREMKGDLKTLLRRSTGKQS